MTTLTQHYSYAVLMMAVGLAGCGDRAAQAPNPIRYDWPERFAYRVDYVSEAQRDTRPLLRYTEQKLIRFVQRDDRYVIVQDSVLKTSREPEGLRLVPYALEDTLAYYAKLGRQGEVTEVVPGCDPAVAACAAALRSLMPLELRRIIPRLPLWSPPRGATWDDTLSFDDAARPEGTRGTVVTRYDAARDTVIGGEAYWLVPWQSVRQAFRRPAPTEVLAAEPPVNETGVTFVEKRRLLPVFSTWVGTALATPAMRRLGATATGYRGRAYLAGSPFDSLHAGGLVR